MGNIKAMDFFQAITETLFQKMMYDYIPEIEYIETTNDHLWSRSHLLQDPSFWVSSRSL